VFFGHSLGSAVATELAASADRPPDALVLQSPFTSARDMAFRMLVPAVPVVWRFIARVQYETRAHVARLDVPVHVAHGGVDITVPSRMGVRVFDAARRRGELLLVPGAGHNDVADAGGEDYWRWLTTAVRGESAPVKVEEQGGRRPH
jgi:pimeloyl-ACP methyl ester carboxylesterase